MIKKLKKIKLKKSSKNDTIQLMIYKTESPKETEKIAALLVERIVKAKKSKGAVVVALEGELGVGKTVFVQGFAKALKIKAKIKSPTFVLMKHYPISDSLRLLRNRESATKSGRFAIRTLYHLDCYRLKNYKELLPLGIKEILKDPDNIILIEWAERVKPILPKQCIKIHIDHVGPRERKITIG